MTTIEVLQAIQDSPVAHAVSKSNHLVGAGLQIVHVLGFILLLSALVMLSLRLVGLALKQQPLASVARRRHPTDLRRAHCGCCQRRC